MEGSPNSGSLKITSSDMTRRELLEVAAVTGGALVGGQLMSGSVPQAEAHAPPQPICPEMAAILKLNER